MADPTTRHDAPVASIEVLSRRAELLAAFEDGARSKATLVESRSWSRSTVARGLRELESIGAIERVEGGYRLSAAGRLMLRTRGVYHERLEGIERASALLGALPSDFGIDPVVLDGATVLTAGGPALHRFGERTLSLTDSAEALRGFVAATPYAVEAHSENISDCERPARFVVDSTVLEELLVAHESVLEGVLSTPTVELREPSGDLPCTLLLAESEGRTTLGVVVYGESGVVGYLENDRPGAIAWGEELLERYWTAARTIDVL